MRYKILMGAVFWFSISLQAMTIEPISKEISISRALYVNCLQRTQTQQLLKSYILSGMELKYKNPKKELAEAIAKYDERLQGLHRFFQERITQKEVKEKLEKARLTWQESRVILEASPEKSKVLVLQKNFKEIISLLSSAKVLAKKSFKAVGLTGGLCREPFYISNLYFMKTWGVDIEAYETKIEAHRAKFDHNIAELEKYEGNTPEIKQHILEAKKAFARMNRYIDHSKRAFVPSLISQKANQIFVHIRTIKKLYGEQLK
jgi:hypothetical protein